MGDVVERARTLAADVLIPAADEVDATATIPEGHFVALADAGLHGLAAPPGLGGPEIGFEDFLGIVETLAGACLTTTFTWMQHHGVVLGLASTGNTALQERYLADAVRGTLRCGVAFAGAIPQPPKLWATRVERGWRLDGVAPLVTGWGIVDVLQVSARDAATADADDEQARVVVDEAGEPEPAAALRKALAGVRDDLDAGFADASRMPAARAAASELAVRAAATLTVAVGSRAIVGRHPARRLAREAAFTLVAAGRPEIRTELLGALPGGSGRR